MNESESADRVGLREYVVVLRRRWRVMLAALVVVPLVSVGYSLSQSPEYVATAELLIEPSPVNVATTGDVEVPAEEVATQVRVVTSLPVAQRVAETLSLGAPPDLADRVTVESVGTSRIVRISARGQSAAAAAGLANAVADSYLSYRQEQATEGYDNARSGLERQQTAFQTRLNEVEVTLAQRPKGRSAELEAERQVLLSQLGRIGTELATLRDSLMAAASGGELLTRAAPPAGPVSPRPLLAGLLGGVLGLMLGAALAVVRDRFDDVIYDEEQMRRPLGQAVQLGRIPRWQEGGYDRRLVSLLAPQSAAGESYQRLAVNVRFLLATLRRTTQRGGVALVTSARPGEGKTVTACNLAVAASNLGLRVTLVDADLRRADAASWFGLGDSPGLTDLLVGEGPVDPYLIDVGVERLRFLPTGTMPPNPAALLSSARMRTVLEEIADGADLVVLDSSPLLAVADALELAGLAELAIVVGRHGSTRRRELSTVLESLRHVGSASVGCVYVGYATSDSGTYPYRPRTQGPMADDEVDRATDPVDGSPAGGREADLGSIPSAPSSGGDDEAETARRTPLLGRSVP